MSVSPQIEGGDAAVVVCRARTGYSVALSTSQPLFENDVTVREGLRGSPAAIRSLRIAVVGTGALGSALLQRLARAGHGSLLLLDPDRVEPRNLPLSPFLSAAMAAQATCHAADGAPYKASLLARHAWSAYRLPWRALPCGIADVGWQRLRACDLLCCCTDSALSRVELALAARTLGKPVLDGAVAGSGMAEGRVTCFSPPPQAACYLCGLGEDRRAAVLGLAASTALGCRPPAETPAMNAALSTLAAVADRLAAAIQQFASEHTEQEHSHAVKLRLAAHQLAGDAGQVAHEAVVCEEELRLTCSESCPWHSTASARLVALPWQVPLRALLAARPGWELLLPWPVCATAVCGRCGAQSQPLRRVAAVRGGPCPACGVAALEPRSTVGRIAAGDDVAQHTLRQLGQPSRHLYTLRRNADTEMSMHPRSL